MDVHAMTSGPSPADPPGSDARLLAQELRTLRDRTGLSLVGLAGRTPFSKSTWHRYLTGEKFPPRTAVEALGRLSGADGERLLALWEAASQARTASAGPPSVAEPLAPARLLALWEISGHAPGESPVPPPRIPHPITTAPTPCRGRGLRRAAVVLAAVAAAIGAGVCATGLVLPVRHPEAETNDPCPRGNCEGQYAASSRCDRDALTESTLSEGSYALRLRFSPSCATVWADVSGGVSAGLREVSVRSGLDELIAALPGGPTTRGRSPMLATSDPGAAVACAYVSGKPVCTGGVTQQRNDAPQAHSGARAGSASVPDHILAADASDLSWDGGARRRRSPAITPRAAAAPHRPRATPSEASTTPTTEPSDSYGDSGAPSSWPLVASP